MRDRPPYGNWIGFVDDRGWMVSPGLPQKIIDQMAKAGLPTFGIHPFVPALTTNQKGKLVIDKKEVTIGKRKGKKGYLDTQGQIWIKEIAHAGSPVHWDVQINGGEDYVRVDMLGSALV